MSTEEERLVVALEARIKDFERNFQRANRTATSNFDQIERRARQSADRLEDSMGKASKGVNLAMAAMKGGLAGLVAGISIGALDGIISRIGGIAKGVANIGNEAKRAGLSSKAFQELGFVAEQNRIPVDALVDGMKELNLRADEFIVTGKGSAAEAFQRLGYGAEELKRKLTDPSALLVEIIGKLEHLDRAAQIRIADELFGGTGGERFVELLDRGAAGIRASIQEANDLGLILEDDVIQRADEIDRKFNAIAATIGTALKAAVVDVVGDMDDWLDRFNKIDEQTTRNVQLALSGVYEKLQAAKGLLSDLELNKAAFPEDAALDLNIERQKQLIEELTGEAMRLRDILDRRQGYSENFIYKTGEDAKSAKPPVDALNGALGSTGNAAGTAASKLQTYADAIRSLRNEVPELAASLRDLDTKMQIDEAYRLAVSKARSMGEVYLANELRGKALAAVNVKSATDDPTRYLSAALASGKAQTHIEGMASAFASKLTTMLANMPDDLKGSVTINSGFRSVQRQQELWLQALQKYGSPEAARKWVAPPGNSQHNKGNAADLGYGSDAARQWVHANASRFGLSFPLNNENWHIEDADARSTQVTAEIDKLTQAATQQSEAYRRIIDGAREHVAAQGTEQQALSMTAQAAAAYRYEQEMLNEAQRAGIQLTPQQRAEIAQLAQGMAQAEEATRRLSTTQEEARAAADFFAQGTADALTGFIMGTQTAEQALQGLLQMLVKATLQAALLGEGPLAGIFGTAGGGGILGSLFGGLFGAKDGGEIQAFASGGRVRGPGGPRSDKVPAWLSDGEHVINAEDAAKNRPLLEAINSGKTPVLPRANLGSRRGPAAGGGNVNFGSINVNVSTQGSSGNTAMDDANSRRIARQVSEHVRQEMANFLTDELRPGGLLWGR